MWQCCLIPLSLTLGLGLGFVSSNTQRDKSRDHNPGVTGSHGALDLDSQRSRGPDKSSALPMTVPERDASSVAVEGGDDSPAAGAIDGNGEEHEDSFPGGDLKQMAEDGVEQTQRSSAGSINHMPAQTPCFLMAGGLEDTLKEVLSGLPIDWDSQRDEEREATLVQFGMCVGNDQSTQAGGRALMALASAKGGESKASWAMHLDKELWIPGEEAGSISLTFEVPQVFEASTYLSSVAPTILLFFVETQTTELLEVTFSSNALLPDKQWACLSGRTRYILLTMGPPGPSRPTPQRIPLTIKIKGPYHGSTLSLFEVQDKLMRSDKRDGAKKRPLLVFSPNKLTNQDREGKETTPGESDPSPIQPPPSRTYQFLCELQRFLSSVLPQRKATSRSTHELDAQAIPLASLSNLPRLVLDVSSSQSLLLGLLNSSTPTLFSFPRHGPELLDHQVALSLQPPLLAVLREELAEALVQFRGQEVGKNLIDRLEKLCEFCSLPAEGIDISEGNGEPSEDHYHALLLLKALQTVLGTWKTERAQRASRSGESGTGSVNLCHLQSLTVSLEAFFLEPSEAAINNCAGECGFPLHNGNNHAVLLNTVAQRAGWTGRAPCCVPTEYEDLLVLELDKNGTTILAKTNMVAKKCGCR